MLSLEKGHIRTNNFTFLRLVAATLVVFNHSFDLYLTHDFLFNYTAYHYGFSRIALWMFFSISGYLITNSAITSVSVKSYLWKRVLRILPALTVVLFLSVVLLGFISEMSYLEYISMDKTWYYLLNIRLFNMQLDLPGVFLSNPFDRVVNGSIWTLAYEFLFYLISILFIVIPQGRKVLVILLIIGFGSLSIAYNHYGIQSIEWLNLDIMSLREFGVLFFVGAFFNLYKNHHFFTNKIIYYLSLLSIIPVIFYVSPLVAMPLVAFVTIQVGLKETRGISRLDSFGDISYGIYIYSAIVQQVFISEFGIESSYALFSLSFVTSLLLGCFSWFMIEKPLLRFKYLFK